MRKQFLFLVLFILFFIPVNSFASTEDYEVRQVQNPFENELRLRLIAIINWNINKQMELNMEQSFYFNNNVTQFEQINTALEFCYKPLEHFDMGIVYQFSPLYVPKKEDKPDYFLFQHVGQFYLRGNWKVGRGWKIKWRELLQVVYTQDEDIDLREECNPDLTLRSRIRAEYSFFSQPVKLYAHAELFTPLLRVQYYTAWSDKVRWRVGVEYRFNKYNSLEFYYTIDQNFGQKIKIDDSRYVVEVHNKNDLTHILAIKYNISF